jgi:hypothetical protein
MAYAVLALPSVGLPAWFAGGCSVSTRESLAGRTPRFSAFITYPGLVRNTT